MHTEYSKADKGRLGTFHSELTALFKDLYKVRYLSEDHVSLFKVHFVSTIKTAFNRACERPSHRGLHFQDFRKMALTNMCRAGIDNLTIIKITGHKTLEVFKRYNSLLEGDLREAASHFNS